MRAAKIGMAFLVVMAGADAHPQDGKDGKKEYDLVWKLPHDHAAAYDVFDLTKKIKRGEFWLLGCELTSRVGATDGRDIPFRFLFRLPQNKIKVGMTWEVKERVFGESTDETSGVQPIEVAGTYRLKEVKSIRLSEVLKVALKGDKAKSEAVEIGLIEGQLTVTQCRRTGGKVVLAERGPSGALTTLAAVRISDGAILGGRFQLSAKVGNYTTISDPKTGKVEDAVELVLREPLIELSRKGLKDRIDGAVERGVKWLRSQQTREGKITDAPGYPLGTSAGVGSTALSLLALLHSGTKGEDIGIQSGLTYLKSKKVNQSYDLGLVLMALEGKYLPMEKFEDVESFSEEKAREEVSKKVTKEDLETATALARLLMALQGKDGGFSYTERSIGNMSNTQYALLGLKSASRLGVAIPTSVWKRGFAYVDTSAVSVGGEVSVKVTRRGSKSEDRKVQQYGWGYLARSNPDAGTTSEVTGSMTAAALAVIAICRSELARTDEWKGSIIGRSETLEWGGIGWLQEHYGLRGNPPEGCWYLGAMLYYYLYGMERAGILVGVDKIADHDWYSEGAALLLSWQRTDGSWEGPQSTSVADTAFALLFLKRATIPVVTPSSSSDGKK